MHIAIKIGTSVIVNEDGSVAVDRLKNIISDISGLYGKETTFTIVASGAVAAGRKLLSIPLQHILEPSEKSMCAAVGQSYLMGYYSTLLNERNLLGAQLLVQGTCLNDKKTFEGLITTLKNTIGNNAIPILNGNDAVAAVSNEERHPEFLDNDWLAAEIAVRLKADWLIVLTDVEGVYTKNPKQHTDALLIKDCITPQQLSSMKLTGSSACGTGGISSKVDAAAFAAGNGVRVSISSGFIGKPVTSALRNESGTMLRPENKTYASQELEDLLDKVKLSQKVLVGLSELDRRNALLEFSKLIESSSSELLAANQQDYLQAKHNSTAPAILNRLKLDEVKIKEIAAAVAEVARKDCLINKPVSTVMLDDNFLLQKITVPIGVFAIIFEARPDVIPQILSLALFSGNGVILKGGSEATHTNRLFMKLVRQLSRSFSGFPENWAALVEGRQVVGELIKYSDKIDLVIPRGSKGFVKEIMEKSKVPVLGHAEGICHLYVHSEADMEKALKIIIDAKCQYPAVCNAVETILVDLKISEVFLRKLAPLLEKNNVAIKGCSMTRKVINAAELADEKEWATEYGELIIAVKVIPSIDDAIEHINTFGSRHTDGIITQNEAAKEKFFSLVDSSSVVANCSTRFSDGFRYGLGAEIGVSTGKIHARGPVGVEGLMTYQWRLRGDGHIVSDYTGVNARRFKHSQLE